MAHKVPVKVADKTIGSWLWNCATGLNIVSIRIPEALFMAELGASIDFPGLFSAISWLADVFGPASKSEAKKTVDKQLEEWNKSHKSGAAVEFKIRFTLQVDRNKLTTPCPSGHGFASLGYELQLKIELISGAAVKTGVFDADAGVAGMIVIVLADGLRECKCVTGGSLDLPEEEQKTDQSAPKNEQPQKDDHESGSGGELGRPDPGEIELLPPLSPRGEPLILT